MDRVCIYLRKSRADEELEKTLGEGETLGKHKKSLLKFAKEKKLNIIEIKEEIVSGESLFFRPRMLELLKEVESKKYSGVLVMDMQRLGRGDMQDQGIILETFKKSKTLIITPQKTYDLTDEWDEEYSEFEAFMSRKELKMINRRMQGGRVRSVEDGNYISANPPIGYDITHINKNRTLKINEHESEIVKLIFSMYTNGNGAGLIADHLNSLNYITKLGNKFSNSSVLSIIKNPIYIGKITWKKKEIKKSKDPSKVKDTRTRDKEEWIIANGKHKPIIDIETFNKAQNILKNRYHVPYQIINGITNPLAGLLICKQCGNKMIMRKLRGVERVMCIHKCGNKSAKFNFVEKFLVEGLENILTTYKSDVSSSTKSNDTSAYMRQLDALNTELNTLKKQKLNLFDLLERGIYDDETFLERSNNLDKRINDINLGIENINQIINEESTDDDKVDVVEFENVLNLYKITDDTNQKNQLMKSIVYKIDYLKKPEQSNDNFEIKIYPKI